MPGDPSKFSPNLSQPAPQPGIIDAGGGRMVDLVGLARQGEEAGVPRPRATDSLILEPGAELSVGQIPFSTRRATSQEFGAAGDLLFNVEDSGLGVTDFIPFAGLPGALEDIEDIKARERAGQDVGFFEKVAFGLGPVLSIMGLGIGKGVKVAGKEADEAMRLIGKFAPELTLFERKSVLDTMNRMAPDEVNKLKPDEFRKLLDPLERAKVKGGQKGVGPSIGDIGDQSVRNRVTNGVSALMAGVVDRMRPIKELDRVRSKALGLETTDLSTYREFRLLAGSRGTVEAVLKHGTIRWDNNGDIIFSGKGLNDTLAPLKGVQDDAALYFVGRRADELMQQGREKLFTRGEIDEMLRLETPAMRTAFEGWQQFNRRMLDFAEQSGLIGREQKQRFIDMGQSYVPFYRMVAEQKNIFGRRIGTQADATSGSLFKRLKGGESNINEVFDNMFRNTVMIVDHSLKNAAMLKLVRQLQTLPGGIADDASGVLTRLPAGSSRPVDAREVATQLRKIGVEIPRGTVPDEMVNVFALGRGLAKNEVAVMEGGKRVTYRVNDDLLFNAINMHGSASFGLAGQILGAPKLLLTRFVTGMPDFQVKNLIRDTQVAFTLSRGNFVPFVDSLRGLRTRMAQNEDYWLYMANGGGFSTTFRGELDQVTGRAVEQLYRRSGIDPLRVLSTPRKIAEAWETVSSGLESGARLREFNIVRGRGGSLRDAAMAGREISTDFAMHGDNTLARLLMTTVPFLNARMQGLYRLAREAKGDDRGAALKFLAKGTVGMAVPALALHWYNTKNFPDEYDALPEWVKDTHWNFPDGEGGWYHIPAGFEVGIAFKALPEQFYNALVLDQGADFADFFGRVAFNTFSVGPPQAIAPVAEIATNTSLFTGAPIVPRDLEDLSHPELGFRFYTSESAKQVADGLGMSPIELEHLVRGYLGTLGFYMMTATDELFFDSNRPQRRIDEIPFAKVFRSIDPLKRTSHEERFYDMWAESRSLIATVKRVFDLAATGDERNIEEIFNDRDMFMFEHASVLDSVADVVSQLRNAAESVADDPSLTRAQKRQQRDKIQAEMNDLFLEMDREIYKNLPERRNQRKAAKQQQAERRNSATSSFIDRIRR
jgi:hypothetical protein